MDTSLTIDSIHGVQPNKVGEYMLDTYQVPSKQCTTQYLGVECGVTHAKGSVVDNESTLLGLDRIITKHEPPAGHFKNEQYVPTQRNTHVLIDSFMPFEPQSTREKRPNNVLSGVSIDRISTAHLYHDSQDVAQIVMNEQYRGGFQSRMNAKDRISEDNKRCVI